MADGYLQKHPPKERIQILAAREAGQVRGGLPLQSSPIAPVERRIVEGVAHLAPGLANDLTPLDRRIHIDARRVDRNGQRVRRAVRSQVQPPGIGPEAVDDVLASSSDLEPVDVVQELRLLARL